MTKWEYINMRSNFHLSYFHCCPIPINLGNLVPMGIPWKGWESGISLLPSTSLVVSKLVIIMIIIAP